MGPLCRRTLPRLAVAAALVGALADVAAADETRDPATFTVCLQPLGKYDKKLLAPLERGLGLVYGFTVTRLAPRAMPDAAWYPKRSRWRADEILTWIDAEVAPGSSCGAVIAITREDVSTTSGEHEDWGVFGLGEIDGISAVVSSKRLTRKASRQKLAQRVLKVAIHELGHVLGLPHRDGDTDPACMMNDARGTIVTVDSERGLPCADERERIEAKLGVTLPTVDAVDWRWVATGKRRHR